MKNKYINIVYTADKNYTDIVGVSMFSVLKNLSKDKIARFFIFSQDFSEKNIEKLNKLKKKFNCEIINVPMEPYLNFFQHADVSKFQNKWITLAGNFRFLMFKILPEEIENCFYIDGDVLINTDLSKIKLPENKIFAAIAEAQAMQFRRRILAHLEKYSDFEKFNKSPLEYPYFNSGFYLANIKKAKELNILDDIIDFTKRYPNPPFYDQDTLNAVFGQKYSDYIEYLPPEYNVFASVNFMLNTYDDTPFEDEALKNAIKNPKIIHYAGLAKPWLTTKNNYNAKFWQYYFASPWKKTALTKLYKILANNKEIFCKIKKTLSAFKISFETNTLFLNPDFNAILKAKIKKFKQENKKYIKNNSKTPTKRLFLTTGNLSLLNALATIKQINKKCEDTLFIHSYITSDNFHETNIRISQIHNFKEIHTHYKKIDLREYFIENNLYEFDEIYFTNLYQYILLANQLYKNAKLFLIDEGCVSRLMRAKIFNYNKIKKMYFTNYSQKIDHWNLKRKNINKIIEIDNQIFKEVSKEYSKIFPVNFNTEPEKKTVLFCGSYYEITKLKYEEYIKIQNETIEKLINLGYTVYFKPHPRDDRNYIDNPLVKIINTTLPLESCNLDVCAAVSFASCSTLHLLKMQNIAGFTIELPLEKPGCKIDEKWISQLERKLILEYTAPLKMLLEINPNNYTKEELKKVLKNKCEEYINSKPLLSENKDFNNYAKELGYYTIH